MLTGRYRAEEVIGVGSFATVHRAADDLLDDTVVVKVLAENHSLNPEIRERFIAEGRSLRRVASPHVVTVHDIGETDRQQPYLVLEHADRGTQDFDNQEFSERRAEAVAEVLGEERPDLELEASGTATLPSRRILMIPAPSPPTAAWRSATATEVPRPPAVPGVVRSTCPYTEGYNEQSLVQRSRGTSPTTRGTPASRRSLSRRCGERSIAQSQRRTW